MSMPMLIPPMKIANTTRRPAVAVGMQSLNVERIAAAICDVTQDIQVVSLDELKVIEGGYRKEQIKSSDELLPGDEFQFLEQDRKYRTNTLIEDGQASLEISTTSRFGPSSFSAAITHSVIFISKAGKLLNGYILEGSRNALDRSSVILCGEIQTASAYTLIEISEWKTLSKCASPFVLNT